MTGISEELRVDLAGIRAISSQKTLLPESGRGNEWQRFFELKNDRVNLQNAYSTSKADCRWFANEKKAPALQIISVTGASIMILKN